MDGFIKLQWSCSWCGYLVGSRWVSLDLFVLPGCLWEFESLPIDGTLYLTRPTSELEQEVGVYFDGWQGWDEGEWNGYGKRNILKMVCLLS